jgi:hypothetical protein
MAGNPIPGNPGKLRDLAQRLRGGWDTLRDLGVAIDQFQHADEWDSDAANEFRGKARSLRKLMGHAEYRFWAVSQALGPYSGDLEEAQRLAGPAAQAVEEARGDLSRATSRHEQLKASDPESDATAEAWRSVDSAQDSIIAAEKRIGGAIGTVKAAAGRFLAATERAVNDPLKDDDSWLAQQKRNLRRTGDWIAGNPWVAPLIGVTSIPLGAFTFALGLASTEDGREFLETAGNWLNIASAALAFIPPAWPVALGLGVLGLAADGALYAHGRKDEGDLGWDVVGIATAGVGRVAKGGIGAVRAAYRESRAAEAHLRFVQTQGRGVAARAWRTANWALDKASDWRGNRRMVNEYVATAERYVNRTDDLIHSVPRFVARHRVEEARVALVRSGGQLAARATNEAAGFVATAKQTYDAVADEYRRIDMPVIGVGLTPNLAQPVPVR